MIYYFLNCHKGIEDSKIKMMIESDGVIQMLEKRVETISDDGWKKIIEDFRKLHENEERMERQLELEEAHKAQEEAKKALQEANKLTELETKRADAAEKQIQDMILFLSSTMDVKAMATVLNMSVDEIEKYKKRKVTICDFLCFLDLP